MIEPDIREALRARDRARKAAWRAKNRDRARKTDKLAKRRARAVAAKESSPKPAPTTQTPPVRQEQRLIARDLLRIALGL
ncbi:MAG: hypothetical protein KJZ75_13980 [Hyphomonadaceae bacterium]|nr:hypothetical protein [Hyphomonadaceae bacterium]